MNTPTQDQRGFVLVFVQWIIVVLALMVSGLLTAAHVETRVTASQGADAQGRAAADGALYRLDQYAPAGDARQSRIQPGPEFLEQRCAPVFADM